MDIKVQLKFARLSPRKTKLVADLVRGREVTQALTQLKVVSMAPAKPLAKLLASGLANAKHNYKQETTGWWIKTIEVGQGPVLRRWMPRAQGRATPIRRPTAHVKVVLTNEAPKSAKKSIIKKTKSAAKPKTK